MVNKQSTLREMALFAGAGGGILGGHLLGWQTVCAVEWEPYPASVLCARQNDGILPPFPIWDDVQTFDGKPWRGLIDVVSGGFPCQDISNAGKGAGITGAKSSMWNHMARIISEVRPRFAYVENSPLLISRGAAMVVGDLAEMGYDCQWGIVSASDCGAPHKRNRFWLVGLRDRADAEADTQRPDTDSFGSHRASVIKQGGFELQDQQNSFLRSVGESLADTDSTQRQGNQCSKRGTEKRANPSQPSWWAAEPNVGRVANGVAARMDRLKAIGNGQVPSVAATAWRILSGT
jgi:DNA (cytosine-5)-methyltransferase 1